MDMGPTTEAWETHMSTFSKWKWFFLDWQLSTGNSSTVKGRTWRSSLCVCCSLGVGTVQLSKADELTSVTAMPWERQHFPALLPSSCSCIVSSSSSLMLPESCCCCWWCVVELDVPLRDEQSSLLLSALWPGMHLFTDGCSLHSEASLTKVESNPALQI